MKIIIDARLYGLENAGLGRYLINLVDNLSKIKEPKFNYIIILRKKYFDELNLPPNFKKICFNARHYSFAEQFFLPIILYREKPDLVHFPHFNVPILYLGRHVVTIHDMLMHRFKGASSTTLPPFLYSIKRFFYYFVFWKAIRFAKLVFVPSKSVAKEIGNKFNAYSPKIRVIYEGVSNLSSRKFTSREFIYKKYNLSHNYIIYCGNSYPHKNLSLVLKSIKFLDRQNISDFDFLIVSSKNAFRDNLEEQVKKYNLEGRVRFLEFVSDSDLAALMHYSLAYVFPSLAEGFGLPGLEAIASGTLVLASDIAVFREVYKNIPFYFDPYDPKSLAFALQKVLKLSAKERKDRVSLGKSFVRNYSWRKMAENVLSSYKEALEAN